MSDVFHTSSHFLPILTTDYFVYLSNDDTGLSDDDTGLSDDDTGLSDGDTVLSIQVSPGFIVTPFDAGL
jgi:hypothetical protein